MHNNFTPCVYGYERLDEIFKKLKERINNVEDFNPQEVWVLLSCVMYSWDHDRYMANWELKRAQEKPDEALRKLLFKFTNQLHKKHDIWG